MLETVRAFGLDRLAAAGEADAAGQTLMRWAVELAAGSRRPRANRRPRRRRSRELTNLRAAWRLARPARLLDDAAALVLALSEVCAWRDLTEPWDWTEELASDPSQADHPHAAAVLGSAANVAYMRGDYTRAERLARRGLEAADDGFGRRLCRSSLAQADLSRGAWDEAVAHDVAAIGLVDRPGPEPGVGALAALYGGDPVRARELAGLVRAADVPSLLGLVAYVVAEIDSVEGHADAAEERYTTAIAHARSVGATFLEAIAAVGLASLLSRSGRTESALRQYREVIEHWANGGNWSHLWVTLRNLADLLRTLDDADTADLLDAAADRAPDAHDRPRDQGVVPRERAPDREEALALARDAIARHVGDSAVHGR